MEVQNKQFTCLELLPHAPTTLLRGTCAQRRILHLLSHFLQNVSDALAAFYINRDLFRFDPHVGETSCQIRACKLLSMDQSLSSSDIDRAVEVIAEVKQSLIAIGDILRNSNSGNSMPKTISLANLIRRYNLSILFSDDYLFLAASYLLTRYKVGPKTDETVIDYEGVGEDFEVSRRLTKKIVTYYQQKLSKMSCDFILFLLEKSSLSVERKEIIPLLMLEDDAGRCTLPCYDFNKVLLSHISDNGCAVLFVIERKVKGRVVDVISMFYQFNEDVVYHLTPDVYDLLDLKQSCFVVHGVVEYGCEQMEIVDDYLKKIHLIGPDNIFLANMAAHPQYSGLRNMEFRENPYALLSGDEKTRSAVLQRFEDELVFMRSKAEKIGCCKERPCLFFAKHAYCARLGAMIGSI